MKLLRAVHQHKPASVMCSMLTQNVADQNLLACRGINNFINLYGKEEGDLNRKLAGRVVFHTVNEIQQNPDCPVQSAVNAKICGSCRKVSATISP